MPLICYQDKNFRSDKLALIDKINSVIEEYQRTGIMSMICTMMKSRI